MGRPSLHVDAESLPWRESPFAGVLWKKLSYDPETRRATVLLKFEAGASYGMHRHPEGEEYLVLEGSIEDNGMSYGAGTFVSHPPGSAHQPVSRTGCVLYVTLPHPIEAIEEA